MRLATAAQIFNYMIVARGRKAHKYNPHSFYSLGKEPFPLKLTAKSLLQLETGHWVFRVSCGSLHAEQFLSLYPYGENEMAKGREI